MELTTTTRADQVTEGAFAPGETLPLVIQPASPGVDLVAWGKEHKEYVARKLLEHGAVLFRGFSLATIPEFEAFAGGLCGELFGEYNDLPHEQGKVYGTTPYPPDKAILFHNESSHLHRWPSKQFFYCIQPSQTGGRTPIFDCREALRVLDPKIVEAFEAKGLMYLRNFVDGFDVPWQQFFHTDDRAVVERYCKDASILCEWKKGGGLRLRQLAPGIIKHPRTGERIFFNQVQLHHISCVDPKVRKSLQMLFKPDDLPRNVSFGDGSPIPDEMMAEIDRVFWKIARSFDWAPRDLLALDNMLVSHARLPYTGPRKIVVAMGDLTYAKDLVS
jgi:alpha-ketoglutarate-dependent taurine dioxygenase